MDRVLFCTQNRHSKIMPRPYNKQIVKYIEYLIKLGIPGRVLNNTTHQIEQECEVAQDESYGVGVEKYNMC